jgi:hypothetical protein
MAEIVWSGHSCPLVGTGENAAGEVLASVRAPKGRPTLAQRASALGKTPAK